MDDAINQALDAWIKFRSANPDFYFPDVSEVDSTWADLDDAMSILDESFADHKLAARAGENDDG